jgi:hypothetical protein
MQVHIHNTYIHTRLHTPTYTHVHTHTYIHTRTYTHVHTHTYIHTYTHTYLTYTYTQTHNTYIHTHIRTHNTHKAHTCIIHIFICTYMKCKYNGTSGALLECSEYVHYITWSRSKTDLWVKVKQNLYKRGLDLRVPGGWVSQISWHSAHECGKVVCPTHRSPLFPRKVLISVRV